MEGYNELAGLIGTRPELGIFRRYLILNARDLLLLQGEIQNLDYALQTTIKKDRNSKDSVRTQFEYSISALKGPHINPADGLQWNRSLELREKLKEYSEALIRFAALCRLPSANKVNLAVVNNFLEKSDGDGELFLKYYEGLTWDDENMSDLTSLYGQDAGKDALSRFIERMTRTVYHKYRGHKSHDPIAVAEAWAGSGKRPPVIYYDDVKIASISNALSMIAASLLPAICTFVLFFLSDPLTRMIMVVVCTILFSIIFTFIASPTRAQCFGATTAFSAVLVVFVSSNGPAS